MKTRNGKMKVRALALAVEGVLVAMYAMPAHADDAGAAALKLPANFVELGASYTPRDSAKFGEYTGMNKSGGYAIGNFSVRGGDAYGDGNGTTRWALTGSDLGLTSRTVGATISNQGLWNFGISYDELRHNLSDSYQTPYQGSMGGNSFTLPGFGLAANTRALSSAQLGAFHNVDISSTRENTSITGGLNLNRQWEMKYDFNHLDQSGAKLMAFGSSAVGGAAGEKISILPMPTNYKTNTVNLALNWLGDKGHATGSYFGSFFRDNNNGVTFDTWQTATATQTMSTAPSNDFHQLNLNGGYAFSARTKLAGGLSYGRNTQNTSYAYDTAVAQMVTPSPTSSLGGYVATKHADLKLTDQTTKDLALSAGIKYDDRDNRTASNIYNFNAISGGNTANYPNTPLSIKKTQLELAGDYRLDKKQQIRLAYDHEQIDRKCGQYAVGGNVVGGVANYPAGTNCVVATGSKDDKLSATYRRKASDAVNLNVGYGYSDRKASFDENARAAFIGTSGNVNLSLPAASPLVPGLNAGDFRGYHPYFEASRKEQVLKAGVNWQANDKLSVVAGGRYTDDNYDSTYGVQKGSAWSLNLDATYAYRENGSISAYVTQQERQRDMTNMQRSPTSAASAASATAIAIPAGATWTNKLKDDDTTVGLNFKQGGLMDGKLDLAGDLTYSLGKTRYDTGLNYSTTTTGGLACSAPTILSCGSLPDIKSAMIQFKLNGTYQLDKQAKVAVGYLFQSLRSDDYYYNGLQYGFTPTSVMPTNQTSGNYAVNMVWASYIYAFK
jgi:MtrB/PioB family decaheme-associated outer membrane protein